MSKLVFSIFLIFAMITASPKKSLAIPLKPIFYQILENTVNDLSPNQSTNQETTTTQEIADSTNTYPSGEQTYPNQPIYQQYPPQQTYPNQPIYQQYPPQIYVIPMYPPQRSTTPVIINNF